MRKYSISYKSEGTTNPESMNPTFFSPLLSYSRVNTITLQATCLYLKTLICMYDLLHRIETHVGKLINW